MALVTDTRFLTGLVAGVALVWVCHNFLRPMPGPNVAARRGMGG